MTDGGLGRKGSIDGSFGLGRTGDTAALGWEKGAIIWPKSLEFGARPLGVGSYSDRPH